jgi:hypothetical protein
MTHVDCTVVVDAGSLTRSKMGQVSGTFHIEISQTSFPSSDWSDLVVAVLLGWLDELRRLDAGSRARTRLPFMDGPFALDVEPLSGEQWHITGVRTDTKESVVDGNCAAGGMLQSCLGAAQIITDECSRRGWTSRDIVELQTLCRKLSRS